MNTRTIRTLTLGAVVSRFGVAGGPGVVVLSERNAVNAFALAARLPVGSPAVAALLALAAEGGEAALTVCIGARLTLTPFGRIYIAAGPVLGFYGLGYVESEGEVVRLTASGREAVARGRRGQERILGLARAEAARAG